MARIPQYDGNQVRPGELRPVFQGNIDVSSGLQQVARGIGQVGEVVDKAVRRDAEAEANTADTNITAGWLEWDAANRRKYQGQNAGDYEVAAKAWWDKARETYAGTLSPLAASAVDQQLGRKRNQAMSAVLTHVNTEKERFADDQGEAAAKAAIEFAVDTGDTVGAAMQVRKIVAERGARKGWTTEQVQADQQRLLGTMHLTMISTLAETDAKRATDYYAQNKGEIPGTAQPQVEKILKGEADNQFAVQFAAERAAKPLSEQLADAAKINDPVRRERALGQIRNNHAMVEAAKKEAEASASDQAWQLVGQGKRVPESVLARMDGHQRVQLQEHLVDRSRLAAERAQAKTDWGTYIDLRERLTRGEPVDLRPYAGTKIAPAQLEQLLDIKSAMAKAGPKQDSMLTDVQRVHNALVGLGIDPKKDPANAGLFTSEVDRRVRAESAARGGKDLTADEKQKVVDTVALDKVYTSRWWAPDQQRPLTLLKPEELDSAYVNVNGKSVKVSSVPMADRQQIIAALKQLKQIPTEQAIVELYMRGKSQRFSSGTVQ